MRINSNDKSAQNAAFGQPKFAGPQLERYKLMSDEEFASIGVNQIAYITHTADDNMPYAICAADGHVLAETENLGIAQALVIGNGLLPVSRH
jgi:hypothetical protein